MRKITTFVLVVAMMISLVACGSEQAGNKSAGDTPLQVLTNVWEAYEENEKFAITGGGPEFDSMVMDEAGSFDLSDEELVDSILGFPSSSVVLLKEAASIMHAMNQNTFTAGAYSVSNASDVDMLISDIEDSILSRQWMCGFPDTLVIILVDNNTLISAFGEANNIETFKDNVISVYKNAEVVSEQSLAR